MVRTRQWGLSLPGLGFNPWFPQAAQRSQKNKQTNKNTLNEVGHPDKILWAFRCLCSGFLKKFVCFSDTGPPSIYSQVLFRIFLQAKEVKRKAHGRELHLGRGQTPWKVLSCFPSLSSALDHIGWGWATFTAKVWNLSPNILE